jgi:hypothetical protein
LSKGVFYEKENHHYCCTGSDFVSWGWGCGVVLDAAANLPAGCAAAGQGVGGSLNSTGSTG